MPKPGACQVPACPCRKYKFIVAYDIYYKSDKPNVLDGGGFANTSSTVQEHLESIIGLFDPTGYTLIDFDQGEEIPLHQYGDEYTWYRVIVDGKEAIIAAVAAHD
ncbi:hypothetical protein LCGC14_1407000 [marine sediment metagenome]|uniref:Uncharacterized protein n=1 Tax=marine sediment metagenome TaxID=412755 RepID=A0A0F9KGE1_9ZZZZ